MARRGEGSRSIREGTWCFASTKRWGWPGPKDLLPWQSGHPAHSYKPLRIAGRILALPMEHETPALSRDKAPDEIPRLLSRVAERPLHLNASRPSGQFNVRGRHATGQAA